LAVLRKGEQLGPFVLDKRMAVGGMAEIWSARKASDAGRLLALKVVLPHLAKDQTLRDMFSDEVRIAERLRHPNIVEVYGAYEEGGWLFAAMEILEGNDLRRLLSGCLKLGVPMPVHVAVMIATDAARALSYAHQAKSESGASLDIVHRDVSPHNVMVTRDGQVKVLDFGIARAKERLTKTTRGVIKGKAAYMAPEQALAQDLTPRTDIYALGIVLWEMLAMRRLFKGSSDAVILAAVCEGKVPSIRDVNATVPEKLGELVMQMLSLKPADRPKDMRSVEYALSRVLFSSFPDYEDPQAELTSWVQPLVAPAKGTAVLPRLPAADDDAATSTDTDPHPSAVLAPPDPPRVANARMPPPDAATEAVPLPSNRVDAPTEAVSVADGAGAAVNVADETLEDLGELAAQLREGSVDTVGESPMVDETIEDGEIEADPLVKRAAQQSLERAPLVEHATELDGLEPPKAAKPPKPSVPDTRPYTLDQRRALADTEAVPAVRDPASMRPNPPPAGEHVDTGPTDPPIDRPAPSHSQVMAAASALRPKTPGPTASPKRPSVAPMAKDRSYKVWAGLGLVVGIAALLLLWLYSR